MLLKQLKMINVGKGVTTKVFKKPLVNAIHFDSYETNERKGVGSALPSVSSPEISESMQCSFATGLWRDFIRQACIYMKAKENMKMILRLWCSTTNTTWICKQFEDNLLLIEIPGEKVSFQKHMSPFGLRTPSSQHLNINIYYANIFVILSGLLGDSVWKKDWMFEGRSVGIRSSVSTRCRTKSGENKSSFLLRIQATPLLWGIAGSETRQSMWPMWDHQ